MKIDIAKDGTLTVEIAGENGGVSRWTIGPGQVEQHLRGIDQPGHQFEQMAKGDQAAARDAAAEFLKQAAS